MNGLPGGPCQGRPVTEDRVGLLSEAVTHLVRAQYILGLFFCFSPLFWGRRGTKRREGKMEGAPL